MSVAEQVLLLVNMGGLNNPYFDVNQSPSFISCYLSWRTRQAMARVFGTPYQRPGPVQRGSARPKQNLPPEDGKRRPLEA